MKGFYDCVLWMAETYQNRIRIGYRLLSDDRSGLSGRENYRIYFQLTGNYNENYGCPETGSRKKSEFPVY